jgi:hypothetical protein
MKKKLFKSAFPKIRAAAIQEVRVLMWRPQKLGGNKDAEFYP